MIPGNRVNENQQAPSETMLLMSISVLGTHPKTLTQESRFYDLFRTQYLVVLRLYIGFFFNPKTSYKRYFPIVTSATFLVHTFLPLAFHGFFSILGKNHKKSGGKVEMHEWMHVVDRSMVLKENSSLLHLKRWDFFLGSHPFFSFQPLVFGAIRALNETILHPRSLT